MLNFLKYKYKFISFGLFLIFFGCTQENRLVENAAVKSNLIENYIKNAKDKSKPKEERRKEIEKAYNIYTTLDDNLYKRKKISQISTIYYNLRDYDISKKMNERMLKLSYKINDSFGISKSYGNLGIYYRKSNIDSAYVNFVKAEKILAKLNEKPFEHGVVLIEIARLLQKTREYSESEATTIRAIKSFVKANDERYLPLSYTNLGTLAKYLGRYDDAIEYHKKAMEYTSADKKDLQTVISYNNIGSVYKSMKNYNKAKEYYNKALSYEIFLRERPKRYALLLDNLAYVNFLSNDNTNNPHLFYKALRIRDSIGDKYGIATNTLHLAEYYSSVENDSVSKMYAEKSRDVSLELKNNEELLKAYQILSDISGGDEGLHYANKYINLNDSLVMEERLFRDKFARVKFETDEIAEENLQISKENQILIIAILGLTALFLLGYIIFRQQQSNKELLFAQTQQEANQEIYRLLLNQQIKLEEGRQLEQQRMSEELHDGVLGRLFGVRLSLDGINQRANDGFTEARNKYIDELKSIEKEIRLISHDLGAETLPSDVAYIDAVEDLIKDLCAIHKIDFEFNNDEDIDWEEIDDQKKVNFFRILQESMQNIFKHANAENIKIDFDYLEDKINLTILDDGIGFKSTKVKKGIGLKNITSRVSQMSGVVQFLSEKDEGTKVAVSVPV